MSVFASHRDLTVAGGTIRLYESGDPDASPVLLLHGAGLDCAELMWMHVVAGLSREHRVLAIDLPRHGHSAPFTGVVDQATLERVVTQVLDMVGVEQVALIGMSMGGAIALGYALSHPERVRGAVVISPGGLPMPQPLQFLSYLSLRTPWLLKYSTMWAARSRGAVRWGTEYNLSLGERTVGFEDIVDVTVAEAKRRRSRGEAAMDDWQLTSYGAFGRNLDFPLEDMQVPTLWLRGVHDPMVCSADVDRAVARTPDAEQKVVIGARHLLPLDQPDEFVALVLAFLAERARPFDYAGGGA